MMEKFDLRSKIINELVIKSITLLENDEIKSGDIIYCTKECADVIFLEKPDQRHFLDYHRQRSKGIEKIPFSGYFKYKTLDGQVKEAPISCVVKITKGEFSSVYEIRGKNRKNRADFCEYTARSIGFRVERKQIFRKYVLKFFGDSQAEVDDFITYYCQNKLELFV